MNAIGNTPLIRLERMSGEYSAEIFVKLESVNPTGSMKDRMALADGIMAVPETNYLKIISPEWLFDYFWDLITFKWQE